MAIQVDRRFYLFSDLLFVHIPTSDSGVKQVSSNFPLYVLLPLDLSVKAVLMRKLRLIIFLLYLVLSGCSDGRKDNDRPTAGKDVPEKDLPVIENEDLSQGLKGVDADGNGIRDDIDRLIAKKYSATSVMKKVAEQHARALQQSMEATTREQAKAAGDEIFRAGDCAYKYLPHANEEDIKFREKMSTEIEALTANTKERLVAYWKGESLSSGMVFRSNKNPTCN